MLLILKVSDKPTWSPLWLAAGACQYSTGIKLRLHMLQYMLQHLAYQTALTAMKWQIFFRSFQ